MAASLVQPQCVCTCQGAGHAHHHERSITTQGLGIGTIALGHPVLSPLHTGGLLTPHHSPSEQHSFSTSPTIVRTYSGDHGNQSHEIVEPRVYPLKGGHAKHTHASYRRDSLSELTNGANSGTMAVFGHAHGNGVAHPAKAPTPSAPVKHVNSWTLCVPVPIPHGVPDATLESLVYTVRYASLNAGNASVQTDIVLSHGKKITQGIVTNYNDLPLYAHYGDDGNTMGYGPPMLNEALGLSLASTPAFKSAGSGWSHYLDHQKIYPNVRIGQDFHAHINGGAHDEIHAYLFFHVYEYPGDETLRSISVDVSATWDDGKELNKRKEERERQLHEFKMERERLGVLKREVEDSIRKLQENVKLANSESEKRVRSELDAEKELEKREEEFMAMEKQAKEDFEKRLTEEERKLKELEEARLRAEDERKRELERRAQEEAARKAREEAEQRAREEAERRAKEEAERKAKEEAERQAKEEEERRVKEETERRAKEEAERKAREEAAQKSRVPAVAEAPKVADEHLQEHIAAVASRLGQKCKNGYAWEKKAHGYKCSGGGHFISFKDLGMQ
ncbi:hypothetical protein AGABI2DRAFT_119457 [Agaricus bisporus var. bisporus H97]|uniref:hypothetical protein n=1 Tax=Agaricus bisporus var. bisporus (strain H97 / ATCC MYA-4626 / FGSC 10389) TaxID=936046 RepID=UPI00029F6976|nr:hypothetical protein AGABI2DRAFT_119457 [Agaricus bisporus var. bisporus H97]EKV45787.1 hypothetical protein AGABI2DRAFT_119457 [Agaricus bisporus var. bisporus H97]